MVPETAELPFHATLDPFTVLVSFDFWLIALVNFAIITAMKQAMKRLNQAHRLNNPVIDVTITFLPLALGMLLAIAPGVLDEHPIVTQAMIGLSAGFLNPFAYKVLSKVPGLAGILVSDQDPARAPKG